ncbi:MAG: hypothetical protein B7Z73_00790 [Planctomycetia bacterium 21-64-5]|nr:MAG: hypothetical protein B7Z73_00790 [Planctomycetia bacterium 21-64-5]
MWLWAVLLACVVAAKADGPPSQDALRHVSQVQTAVAPLRVAMVEPDDQDASSEQPRPETREQLAELSRQVDHLVKQSQQQQRIAQYQLVAMAAISILLVMLLVSGSLRRKGAGSSE